MKKIRLVVAALLITTILLAAPFTSALAQGNVEAQASPIPYSPSGSTADTTPTYIFSRVTGATQYQYNVLTGTTPVYTVTVAAVNCGATPNCVNTPATVLPYAKYSWQVRAMVGGIWQSYSALKSFTVTNIPTPISPGGYISDTTPTFVWAKIAGVPLYQFTLLQGTTTIYTINMLSSACGAANCANTPLNVLPYGRYGWKIRAQIGGIWQPYSTVKAFTLTNIPTPLSPAGFISDTTPGFAWNKIAGVSEYQFQLSKGTSIVYTVNVLSANCGTTANCLSSPVTVLTYGSYSWKVRAMIGGVWQPFSAARLFTLTNIPTPASPSGYISDKTPTYAWNKISGVSDYEFQLFKGGVLVYSLSVPAASCGTTANCVNTPATTLTYGLYAWKVRAQIDGIWQPFSPLKVFTLTNIPTPLNPTFYILNTSPSFVWNKIAGVTQYRFQLLQANLPVYTVTVLSTDCGATANCVNTPATVLPLGGYTWKVQAMVDGIWQPYSALAGFKLVAIGPGFSSTFTTDSLGWSAINGPWGRDPNGYYLSTGLVGTFASAAYKNYYNTLTYEVRMKRIGPCLDCVNYLIIRGFPDSLDPAMKDWTRTIRFQYTNTGFFSIWKSTPTGNITIHTFTQSAAIIKGGFNVLKVTASGPNMKFYINGVLVWSGSVASESFGRVGVGMFTDTTGNVLYVDYANLSMTYIADKADAAGFAPVEELSSEGDGSKAP